MPETKRDEWTLSLPDGRTVKYSYEDLRGICSASAEFGNKSLTKIVPTLAGPTIRQQVQELFASEIK
jgi:hypothetical protein